MKIKSFLYIVLALISLASTTAWAWGSKPSVSGRAFVLKADVAGVIDAVFEDTGSLPSTGGTIEKDLKEIQIPGLITAELLHAKTSGVLNNKANSEASVAKVLLTILNLVEVRADLITSNTQAACVYGKATTSGKALLDNLIITVGGTPIVITDEPNATTTINVPLVGTVKVILEETNTRSAYDDTYAAITVNAVHVIVKNLLGLVTADIIVSSAYSDIRCSS